MSTPDFIGALNAVDAILLAALGISIILGALRGLVFEVMSLAGWLVAYAAAYIYSPRLPPLWSPDSLPADSAVMPLVSFALVFAGVLIAWNLLSHMVRLLVRATPLSSIDRILGSIFGFARGVLLLLAIAVVVALTPWAKTDQWRHSQIVPQLNEVLVSIKPLLPPGLHRWMSS